MATVRRGRHFLTVDGRAHVPVGAHVVPPEGPDWPWRVGPESFAREFGRMARLGLDTARIDVLWAAVEPEPGRYDDKHLAVLDEVLAAARRAGLRLHPALLVGGEVGDAFWDVPWRGDRDPHADPELRELQAAHVAMLARRWRGDPAVLAWDLTDEPPFWAVTGTTDDDARAWTSALAAALREADPEHLVTVGTASQEVDGGPFRADVVAPDLDFACVHPYPIYSPELYPDGLLDPRMTHSAAFETALAAGAGRPVAVHEFGASSAQYDPERIAAYDRLLCWSSFGRGAVGFWAWCWIDAEPAAYGRVPYVRMPHETQFGLLDHAGEPRPRARELARLAATLRAVDLDAYASHGPAPRAAVVVPYEYARAYDPAGYGLGAAAAGPYVPAERTWNPEPDVKPLVRAWLNAFVLAARAGTAVRFPRERLDGTWPDDARLLLLPAPLASTTTSLWHVRTSYWRGAPAFHQRGGTLYVSLSADVAIPEMEAVAGCRIVDRAPARGTVTFRFTAPWGPFRPGDVLELPGAPDDLATRGARIATADARTIAVDADGEPVLVVADRAAGHTVVCAEPVELLLARIPDAHRRHAAWHGLYAGVADLADAREDAHADHPDATTGTLRGPDGGLVTVTNHSGADVTTRIHLPGHERAWIADPDGPRPVDDTALSLAPYETALMIWHRDR
ncbi:glycoside hydrolase 5 family protein [Actinomadura chibensis]|uniref:mannan endo-1,4-beta-mannosidase n=1 Tax=Actinomadura chibensis TaxID=392828 RepID=A0A5D0N9B2_9ACTN|nr:cellulase family glycosylhydrolase [Actinomadura chibensis]TYB41084.1 cellulase family glycosylhydrolase [Actinomadura chibensis]